MVGLVAASALLVLIAAGCGGGGGGEALTKEEYASKLNAICNEANPKLEAVGLTDLASFKTNGDKAIEIAEDTVKEFKKLKAPEELRSAAGTFNDSADEIVEDIKNATEAAKADDAAKFQAAGQSVQNHSSENDEAAKEIGANDCVGG